MNLKNGENGSQSTYIQVNGAPNRLHVKIFDDDQKQFTIPESVITLPRPDKSINKGTSDLLFNYEPTPFSFWITRRSEPDLAPLFDTRSTSLPNTPIPPFVLDDNSTALDGFPLVFEDQYLQVCVRSSSLLFIDHVDCICSSS